MCPGLPYPDCLLTSDSATVNLLICCGLCALAATLPATPTVSRHTGWHKRQATLPTAHIIKTSKPMWAIS